jgi:putative endonuclease
MTADRQRRETGRKGEDLACTHLASRGHVILERNWRAGHLELDIITLHQDGIHFVEVKTRRAPIQARPEENVNWTKQKKIVAAAKRYLSSKKARQLGDLEIRFDVISIIIFADKTEINHITEAFIPLYI